MLSDKSKTHYKVLIINNVQPIIHELKFELTG